MLTRAAGNITNEFLDESDMITKGSTSNTLVQLITGERYSVDTLDKGNGILLSTGNYANPFYSFDIPIVPLVTPHRLLPEDRSGSTFWMDFAGENTLTIRQDIDEAYPDNTVHMVMQEGVGVTKIFAVPEITLNGIAGGQCTISAQYQGATIVKRAANTWVVTGAISVVAAP